VGERQALQAREARGASQRKREREHISALVPCGAQRQYLYVCTGKASKLSTDSSRIFFQRQYLYFCTSKASKVSTDAVVFQTNVLESWVARQRCGAEQRASVFVLLC